MKGEARYVHKVQDKAQGMIRVQGARYEGKRKPTKKSSNIRDTYTREPENRKKGTPENLKQRMLTGAGPGERLFDYHGRNLRVHVVHLVREIIQLLHQHLNNRNESPALVRTSSGFDGFRSNGHGVTLVTEVTVMTVSEETDMTVS